MGRSVRWSEARLSFRANHRFIHLNQIPLRLILQSLPSPCTASFKFLSRYSYFEKGCRKNVHATILKGNMGYQTPPHVLRFSHGRGERETRVTGHELQGTMGRVLLTAFLCAHVLKREVWVRGRDQYTVSDHCTCRTLLSFSTRKHISTAFRTNSFKFL